MLIGATAAIRFGSLAATKGYLAAKARRYPLLLTLMAVAVAVALYLGSILIGMAMPHWRGGVQSVYLVGNWFNIAVFLLILNKAYSNMKSAKNARGHQA